MHPTQPGASVRSRIRNPQCLKRVYVMRTWMIQNLTDGDAGCVDRCTPNPSCLEQHGCLINIFYMWVVPQTEQ